MHMHHKVLQVISCRCGSDAAGG